MSLRARPTTTTTTTPPIPNDDFEPETPKTQPILPSPPPSRSSSLSQRALSQTLTGTANLANLLPTGTILALQLLTPIFTTNGSCDSATRPLTLILLLILALFCFLASFTDSIKASDGQVYYGFATFKGMWLFDGQAAVAALSSGDRVPDLSIYSLGVTDGVHAVLSLFVFVAVAMRDKNVLGCFYPMPAHETQEVLDILPIGIGLICSLLFVVFPTKRHGIGYPVTSR